MSAKARLILILAAAVTIYSLLTWFALSSHSWRSPTVTVTFFILFILGTGTIYPLFRILRKRPRLSALAILLVIVSVICGLASLAGSLFLHLDTGWVNVAANLCEGLIIASCMLFIWSGLVQRKRNRQ
jgi:hypothetical protein